MFGLISIAALSLTLVACVVHALATAGDRREAGGDSRPPEASRARRALDRCNAVAYVVLAASVLVLGWTGLVGAGFAGRALTGYPLLVHVGLGGVFGVALAVVAVLRAECCRFRPGASSGEPGFGTGRKLLFWVIAALGLAALLSTMCMMLPVFGTHDQRRLLEVHRYGGLLVLTATLGHVYLTFRSGRG